MRTGIMIALLIPLVLVLPLSYVLARRTLGPTAGTRRFLSVLPILLGCLMLSVLGVLFISFAPRSVRTNGFIIFQVGFVLLTCGFIGYMQYRTRHAGALLLDLGWPRQQRFLAIIGLIMAASAVIFAVLSLLEGGMTIERGTSTLFQVTLASFYVFIATRRTQLREHGLLVSGDVIRWHTITGYHWERDRLNTLTLRTNRNMFAATRPSLPIPPQHRDAVDRLLAQHVGPKVAKVKNSAN